MEVAAHRQLRPADGPFRQDQVVGMAEAALYATAATELAEQGTADLMCV